MSLNIWIPQSMTLQGPSSWIYVWTFDNTMIQMPKGKYRYVKIWICSVYIFHIEISVQFWPYLILTLKANTTPKSSYHTNMHKSDSSRFARFSNSPLLNPASLPEKPSAWTPQLQQASCQARFLQNIRAHKQKTWKKRKKNGSTYVSIVRTKHTESRINHRARMWLGVHWAWQQTHLKVTEGHAGIVLSTIFQISLADDFKHKTIWEIEVFICNKYCKLQ